MRFLPSSSREWRFMAAGALLAAAGVALTVPRYQIRQSTALAFLRVDRWTGTVERCYAVCQRVTDETAERAAPAAAKAADSLDTGGYTLASP